MAGGPGRRGGKFIVLELVALLFADRVQLGGFFAVTGLILVLMLARGGVRRMLSAPGPATQLHPPRRQG